MNDNLEEIYEQIHLEEQALEEGLGSTIGHAVLDIAGLGFDIAAGNGAWFDAANAIWYANEKNYLYAAFSLISAIPIIGDIVGKGGKYLNMFDKTRKMGASMYKAGKTMKSANTISKISKAKSMIKDPATQSKIDKVFDLASKNEKLAPHVEGMRAALDQFANEDVITA